jgi:DNA-binding transcriptional LysR family regulator
MNAIDRARQMIARGDTDDQIIKDVYQITNKRLSASTVEALRTGVRPAPVARMRTRGRPKLAITKNDCYRLIIDMVNNGVDIGIIYEALDSLR